MHTYSICVVNTHTHTHTHAAHIEKRNTLSTDKGIFLRVNLLIIAPFALDVYIVRICEMNDGTVE